MLSNTGVYQHPAFTYPSNHIVAFHDFVNNRGIPYDDNGHGTHVVGDARGERLSVARAVSRAASSANIVSVKVLNRNGQGKMSDILPRHQLGDRSQGQVNVRVLNSMLLETGPRRLQERPPSNGP